MIHLANDCQPKTLISSTNEVCSSTLLFKHEIVPNVSFEMQEVQGQSSYSQFLTMQHLSKLADRQQKERD